ncbi:MAG: thrombospondin type 3 repeat-containing protein [Solirubrobacteraceae bacterium]
MQRIAVVYLFIDTDGNAAVDDVWIFDPYFQNAADELPDQGAVEFGVWQRWDALAGGWYSSSGLAGTSGGIVKSLASLAAAAPGARLRPIPVGATAGPAVRFVAGDEPAFAAGAVEYVDDIEIGSGQALTRSDFEPDDDGDGIADGYDDCPAVANGAQTDTDRDGLGDACDEDDDGDAVLDADDAYPLDPARSIAPTPQHPPTRRRPSRPPTGRRRP